MEKTLRLRPNVDFRSPEDAQRYEDKLARVLTDNKLAAPQQEAAGTEVTELPALGRRQFG